MCLGTIRCKHCDLQASSNPATDPISSFHSEIRIHMAAMPPEGINTLAGRIESFITEHHLAKRRASSVKKRAGGNAVTWPHNFLPAEQVSPTLEMQMSRTD